MDHQDAPLYFVQLRTAPTERWITFAVSASHDLATAYTSRDSARLRGIAPGSVEYRVVSDRELEAAGDESDVVRAAASFHSQAIAEWRRHGPRS